MKKEISHYLILFIFLPVFFSCSTKVTSHNAAPGVSQKGHSLASAPCIIYKTKADYYHNVPVTLNEKKSFLSSYPDVKDIYFNGKLAYPTQLSDGFLLDNRGIGPNVAFLSYTYEDYRNLSRTPSVDDLMKRILDNDPIFEMYQCGTRNQYQNMEKELNDLITSGKLNTCKKIK